MLQLYTRFQCLHNSDTTPSKKNRCSRNCCFVAAQWRLRIIIPFIVFISIITPFSASAKNNSFIGINRFSIDTSISDSYTSLDVLLFQRLNFELLPHGIKPLLIRDTLAQECTAYVNGTITALDNEHILTFTIAGVSGHEEETKKIILNKQPPDAIVDIMSIKVHHFLEQNISGKLRISSSPLDCDLLLNGIKIGKTPAELVLEQGSYHIEIQREYLFPFSDSVTIDPGHETSLAATLEFKGHSIKPWFTSAVLFTGCTILAQLLEMQLHKEYSDLKIESRDLFTKKFNEYKIANSIKIGLFIPMATTWTITGYQLLENRSLKRRIFE